MTDESPAAESPTTMICPKDGAAMAAFGRGRRSGAYRCPECKSMFLDVETMRGTKGRAPAWAPMVTSIVTSVLLTVVVRRLLRRSKAEPPPSQR